MKTTDNNQLEEFYSIAVDEGVINIKDLDCEMFYLTTLFADIRLDDAVVLDIGGGNGELSFYAVCTGAKKVVCLEPEAEGSKSDSKKIFKKMRDRLELQDNLVVLEPVTFQSYEPGETKFDIILLHNSVNHLNEDACTNLLESETSKNLYRKIFTGLYALANTGAKIILCDCSRYNFFSLLHIRNPFAPIIAWHTHQAPNVWSALLQEVGFGDPVIRWTSFRRLFRKSKIVNRILFNIMIFLKDKAYISYFLNSHFCLTMTKK